VPIQDTWKALEEVVDEGLATNIGVSNFQGSLLVDLLRYARIKPAALQIEHHPYLTQEPLIKFAQANDIAVTAYSSLGPASYIELDMGHGIPSLMEHDTITKIASKHGKSEHALRFRRGRRFLTMLRRPGSDPPSLVSVRSIPGGPV
jgi:D-xylose reductase